MRTLPHTHSCFVCGESNPVGLKLRFETDGRIVQTRFVPRAEHVGFRQTVHRGIIATLLDQIMAWAGAGVWFRRAVVRSFCNCKTWKLVLLPLSSFFCSASKASSA